MDNVHISLLLLLAVALSGFCFCLLPHHSNRRVPLPIIQIAIGIGFSGTALKNFTLDPDVFMTLFIPPLLFADGWRIPKRELFREHRSIIALAFGLALASVVTLGYFLHSLIPSMPASVAFALAGVLAPTDAVAFSEIVGRQRVPQDVIHILNGEALMNDASGLIAFKFSVAAAMTGAFSLGAASLSFVFATIGGLAVGAAIGWLSVKAIVRLFMRAEGADPAAGVVLTFLIPFAGYIAAEALDSSGVLSAVAAGIVMNHVSLRANIPSLIRIRMKGMWSTIEFVLSGVVFVILGIQFPRIIGRAFLMARHETLLNAARLPGYVLAAVVVLYAIRFLWIVASQLLTEQRHWSAALNCARQRVRMAALMTLGGVRGAVTLAGILALPLTLPSGNALPARDVAIFIASGVTLISFLLAIVCIPFLLRRVQSTNDPRDAEEQRARLKAARAAIRAVSSAQEGLTDGLDVRQCVRCADANARVINLYSERLDGLGDDEPPRIAAQMNRELEQRLRMAAFHAERAELVSLRDAGEINDEILQKLIHEIDLAEAPLDSQHAGMHSG